MAKKAKKTDSKKNLSREEQLELLMYQMNKALKSEGKVFVGRDLEPLERIPIGLLAFDTITGGGLVRKHYLELYGEESSGKTLTALMCVAAVQEAGGTAVWIVGEEFDDDWAERNGVDTDKLIKIEALTGDLMLEMAATALESGLIDLVVLDSIQAIGSKREYEDGVDHESFASSGAPQMWARFYRRTRSLFNARKSKATVIGISQVRDNIGGWSPRGQPEPIPTRIRVIKHWKSISILCKKGEIEYEDMQSEKRRMNTRTFHFRCVKNKTAPPEKVSSYTFNFRPAKGEQFGVDRVDEALKFARIYGLIEGRGKKLQGYGIKVLGTKELSAEDAFKEELKKSPETVKELYTDAMAISLED